MTENVHRNSRRSARHLARVFALLGLYQWIADPTLEFDAIDAHLSGLISDEGEALEGCAIAASDFGYADKALYRSLLSGVILHHEELEQTFSAFVDRELSRVSLVERAILLLGTFEMVKCPQTPYRVVLNESIELAKEFGSGYRFTNAVLEHVAQSARAEEFSADHAKKPQAQ